MATSSRQIDLWRQSRSEHEHLEFKEAKLQYDFRKLLRYCVALANEGGGVMLFGIADRPPRQVVGTQAFPNPVATSESLLAHLGFRVEIEEVTHPEGRVVVFRIPGRPRGTAYHLDGAYLMRSGEELVPMSEDRLRTIFGEGAPAWEEEHALSDLPGESVIELLDTQTYFELMKLPYPMDRSGVLERLERERLIDEFDGGYRIRRLGALLLAKRLSDFPDLVRKAPRVVVYNGTSKLDTRIDQPGARGLAVGFRRLVEFAVGHLPQHEVVENALRKQIRLVPEVAIRELIANALVHQDLRMTGMSVMVEVYSDRVEFSNPGEPMVTVDHFIDGYRSRNERLADLMRRMGICEEKGSGIDRVVTAAEEHRLPAPSFLSAHRRTLVSMRGRQEFERLSREDRIRACYQHCALKYVMSQRMTNQSLRERFQVPDSKSSTVTVSQVIAATVDAGYIKPDEAGGGSKRFAKYVPFWA